VITLYDAPRCPYCARVRIVLAEKGIEVDVVEVDLSDRPAWIYEKNPTGRVPVEPPLLPADPADRGAVRLLVFRDHDLTDPYYALRRGEDGAAEQLDAVLGRFDRMLDEQPYLAGSEYGLADIAYVPWVLRARDMLGVDLDGFPALAGWLARLEQRPAIAVEAGIVAAL
jgi:stringent starvation protein A